MDEHRRQQVPGPHIRKAHHNAKRHELREIPGRQMGAGKEACTQQLPLSTHLRHAVTDGRSNHHDERYTEDDHTIINNINGIC